MRFWNFPPSPAFTEIFMEFFIIDSHTGDILILATCLNAGRVNEMETLLPAVQL